MTGAPLSADFPWRSPLSQRAPGHGVPLLDQLAAVEAELARRRAPTGYQRQVDKGALTAAQAAEHIAILDAIRHDLATDCFPAERNLALAQGREPPSPPHRAGPDFPWEAKVREIRRELAIKRNTLPRHVASATNPMSEPEARRILECWDALHWLYFAYLAGFDRPLHERLAFIAEREAGRARGPAWRDHVGETGAVDPGQDWLSTALLARKVGQGRPPLEVVTPATLHRLAHAVHVRAAEALAASESTAAGTIERALAEPMLLVAELDRWLARLDRLFGPAHPAEPLTEEAA